MPAPKLVSAAAARCPARAVPIAPGAPAVSRLSAPVAPKSYQPCMSPFSKSAMNGSRLVIFRVLPSHALCGPLSLGPASAAPPPAPPAAPAAPAAPPAPVGPAVVLVFSGAAPAVEPPADVVALLVGPCPVEPVDPTVALVPPAPAVAAIESPANTSWASPEHASVAWRPIDN